MKQPVVSIKAQLPGSMSRQRLNRLMKVSSAVALTTYNTIISVCPHFTLSTFRDLPETLRKLRLSTKFTHQQIW